MRPIITTILIAGLAAALGCNEGQILRTDQDRPTTAPSAPVRTGDDSNTIPSGTEFAVRVNENIQTKEVGKTYPGEVAQDIEAANGRILLPKGSAVELVVADASGGGTVGTATVELALKSVTVNGQTRAVTTAGTQERGPSGLGTNRRTAEMVGGGAALGALVGAIAGGGSGAAVGAAVGAAAGGAAQVLTKGKEVKIPAETVLTFKLDSPLQVG